MGRAAIREVGHEILAVLRRWSGRLAGTQQAKGGLGVGKRAIESPVTGLRQGDPVDLDELGGLVRGRGGGEAGCQEQMQPSR